MEPKWEFRDEGKEIWQGLNSRAAVAIGKDRLSGVDFSGTIFVETDGDDDFVGFVFSFQDSSNFYVVYSAKESNVAAQGPWRIVRVASETGPSKALNTALWAPDSVFWPGANLLRERKRFRRFGYGPQPAKSCHPVA